MPQRLECLCHSAVQSLLSRALGDGGAVHNHDLQEQDPQRSPSLGQLRARPWRRLCGAQPVPPRYTALAPTSAQALLPPADAAKHWP